MADSVGDVVCRAEPVFRLLLAVVVFLVLLFLFSLLTIERGTPAFYISIANFVILSSALLIAVGLLYYCRQRDEV